MAFDFSTLIPVGEQRAATGLPAIGSLLSKVVPFPFSLAVEPLFNAVASALNVDPASPTAPADVQAAIQADPAAAVQKLQTIEDAHKAMADAANDKLRIETADVQDARATEVRLAQAGSPLASAAAVVSAVIVVGFIGMLVLLAFHQIPDSPLMNIMMGTLAAAFGAVVNFYLGSSAGSQSKTDTLASLARAPTVQAAPGAHVNASTISGGKR